MFSRCESIHDFELEILVLWINYFRVGEYLFCKFDAFVYLMLVEVLIEFKEQIFMLLIKTEDLTRTFDIIGSLELLLDLYLDFGGGLEVNISYFCEPHILTE